MADRTAGDWQVTVTEQVKRGGQVQRQGRHRKQLRLELPEVVEKGVGGDQMGGTTVPTGLTPASEKLPESGPQSPARRPDKTNLLGRGPRGTAKQLSLAQCWGKLRQVRRVMPEGEGNHLSISPELPVLTGDVTNCHRGDLPGMGKAGRDADTARTGQGKEKFGPPGAPSIAKNFKLSLAEDRPALPTCTIEGRTPATAGLAIDACQVPDRTSSRELQMLMAKLYRVQPALCWVQVQTDCGESAPRAETLVQEKVGREGFKIRTWMNGCEEMARVQRDGSKFCTTHDRLMTKKHVRVASWKKCGDGLHRRVYKMVYSWWCNFKPENSRNFDEPTAGESKPVSVQPVQMYSIFNSSKRRRKQQ